MIRYDQHMHSEFSTDSDAPMEEMIKKAISLGLEGITFTDHIDYHFPDRYAESLGANPPLFTFDLPKYRIKIQELKEKYKDQIQISTGVELGLKPDAYEKNLEVSQMDCFDFIIGSIHLIQDYDPYYPDFWEKYGVNTCLSLYLDATLEALPTFQDLKINTLGHLDYATRYVPEGRPANFYSQFQDKIHSILDYLIQNEIALEINSSGYKNGGNAPNPDYEILEAYYKRGGRKITFGSDAHEPQRIAQFFDKILPRVKEIGFTHYEVYQKKIPTKIPL